MLRMLHLQKVDGSVRMGVEEGVRQHSERVESETTLMGSCLGGATVAIAHPSLLPRGQATWVVDAETGTSDLL
jgi:hypothetical protein